MDWCQLFENELDKLNELIKNHGPLPNDDYISIMCILGEDILETGDPHQTNQDHSFIEWAQLAKMKTLSLIISDQIDVISDICLRWRLNRDLRQC